MTGAFEFAIVMDESTAKRAKKYAVMDLQGTVIRQGNITSTETVVPVLSAGSYIVKVGLGIRRVNVH